MQSLVFRLAFSKAIKEKPFGGGGSAKEGLIGDILSTNYQNSPTYQNNPNHPYGFITILETV